MYLIPHYKKCLDDNGKISGEKAGIEFQRLYETFKKFENTEDLTSLWIKYCEKQKENCKLLRLDFLL